MNLLKTKILEPKLLLVIAMLFVVNIGFAQGNTMADASMTNGKPKVDVYPNPTTEKITIDLSKLDVQEPKIEIRSIIGSKMTFKLEKLGDKRFKVDVGNFPRGYYLVLVMEDRSKFQQTVRFSKK